MVGYCLRNGSLDESNLAEASFVFLPVSLMIVHTHSQACKLIDESINAVIIMLDIRSTNIYVRNNCQQQSPKWR